MIKKNYFNDDNTPKTTRKDIYKDVCNRCDRAIEKHENEFNDLTKKLKIFEINKKILICKKKKMKKTAQLLTLKNED
jgi:hypothetical protein